MILNFIKFLVNVFLIITFFYCFHTIFVFKIIFKQSILSAFCKKIILTCRSLSIILLKTQFALQRLSRNQLFHDFVETSDVEQINNARDSYHPQEFKPDAVVAHVSD